MAQIAVEDIVTPCGRVNEGRIFDDNDPALKGVEYAFRKATDKEVADAKAHLEALVSKGLGRLAGRQY